MRFKILVTIALILLGIVVLLFYPYPNSGILFNNYEGIIQKIEYNNQFFEVSKDWDGFEAVTIDTDEFIKAADEGNVILKLMGEDFKIRIQEASRKSDEDGYYYFYTGHVIGSKQSTADLYVDGEYLYGSIEPGEPWNVTYNIAHTDKKYDGKIVHVVFMQDWAKEKERLEQMGIDPLQFFLINNNSKKHVMSIEIFDFNNKSVFKENYTMGPGEKISSPKIEAELGQYRYELILDNEITFEEKIQADYAANLSSSEKLYIYISSDPENPVTFGIEVS